MSGTSLKARLGAGLDPECRLDQRISARLVSFWSLVAGGLLAEGCFGSWLNLAKDVIWGQVVAWFYVAAVEHVVWLCGRAEAGKDRLSILYCWLLKPG